MAPNTNNTPQRIEEVSDLVATLADALSNITELKNDVKETNCALAICEILTGLPPAWFTAAERSLIIHVIQGLHGDPLKFINSIIDGDVSYVNKAESLVQGKTCDEIVELVMAKHLTEYGKI